MQACFVRLHRIQSSLLWASFEMFCGIFFWRWSLSPQLHALSDVLASSADESQHELLQRFNVLQLLVEIIDGNMMDPEREKNLQERQTEIDELWYVCVSEGWAKSRWVKEKLNGM
jgi:hypothetical protein